MWGILLVVCLLLWKDGGVVEGSHVFLSEEQSVSSNMVAGQYRTGYHFQPPRNWINDPNGPMYYNGIYHLFYQYNPYGSVWGNITWAHSVSTDLINWEPVEPAINGTMPFDKNGCWSGSATILRGKHGNKPAILYTGIDEENRQVQNIAFPKNLSDPYLRQWTKPGYNPIMAPVGDIDPSLFRDPTTGWQGNDSYWRVAVGAQIGNNGTAILYRSRDFVHWMKAEHPLYASNGSGMWECPDFYPVKVEGREGLDTSVNSGDIKHVLKMSLSEMSSDRYMLGSYLEEEDRFVPDNAPDDYRKWFRYDHGNFYASKTFFDPEKNRRILWGWSKESDSRSDDIVKGWAGIQIIPRVVWLHNDGRQLMQWPVKELELLREKEVHLHDIEIRKGEQVAIKGISSLQADVEIIFELPSLDGAKPFDPSWELDPQKVCGEKNAIAQRGIGPFGLLVLASQNLEEHTAVFFTIFKAQNKYMTLMCSDQRRSSLRSETYKPAYGSFVDVDLRKDGKIHLRTLIDHSVVESFGGGGRTCITSRVYPEGLLRGNTHLFAFNNGSGTLRISEIKAWEMKKPRVNLNQDEMVLNN